MHYVLRIIAYYVACEKFIEVEDKSISKV